MTERLDTQRTCADIDSRISAPGLRVAILGQRLPQSTAEAGVLRDSSPDLGCGKANLANEVAAQHPEQKLTKPVPRQRWRGLGAPLLTPVRADAILGASLEIMAKRRRSVALARPHAGPAPRANTGVSELTRTLQWTKQLLRLDPFVGRGGIQQVVASGKKIDKSAQIGDAGIAMIHQRASAMEHVWHERKIDAGIDGLIELRDPATGEVSNCLIQVQSKASNRDFPSETTSKFHYISDDRDLEYWLQSTLPVILVCSHPKTQEAWWVHIQDHFGDPARRAECRVDFDKATMAFDDDITDRLFAVADPHGRAHTPVADERPEVLVSNLLPVVIPNAFWSYRTRLTKPGEVYLLQRESGLAVRDDFILTGGQLLAWAPVEGTALARAQSGCPRRDAHVGHLLAR